jgi:4-amino-4-deoxy-L-arabinose transferase-like glycosyltransferase
VGVVAAAIVAFYPTLLVYNQLFLSEVLFAFLVTSGALLTVRVARTSSLLAAFLLGLCLGLGALTRSVLWLFAPVLAVGLVLLGQAPWPRRIAASALAITVFAGVIAPWAWRNTQLHKTLTFVDVMGGRNVMMGNYEYTPLERSWATIESQSGDRAWNIVLAKHTDGYLQLTQGQIDKAAMKYGIGYFFGHPWLSLQRSTVKFFNYWQLERELVAATRVGLFGEPSLYAAVAVGLVVCGAYALTLFGAVFGVFMVPPPRRADLWLLAAWIAFPCALHTVAFAHSRYHVPFVPILAVFAAAAFRHGPEIVRNWKSRSFAVACLVCIVFAASWARELVMVDLKWFQ